jgi:hypothetical protein
MPRYALFVNFVTQAGLVCTKVKSFPLANPKNPTHLKWLGRLDGYKSGLVATEVAASATDVTASIKCFVILSRPLTPSLT